MEVGIFFIKTFILKEFLMAGSKLVHSSATEGKIFIEIILSY